MVAFGSFTFDDQIPGSVLVIPSVTIEQRGGSRQVIAPGGSSWEDGGAELDANFEVRYAGSSVSELDWLDAVAGVVKTIQGTSLDKVVLARDIHIWSKTPFHVPTILHRLQQRFPECYTFAVDGFLGATPELLVGKRGDRVHSLVLAGTAPRATDPEQDEAIGKALLGSAKDLDEHAPAVASVVDVLGGITEGLRVGEPHLLKLANVQHIATSVEAAVDPSVSVLDIVAALHPTAAVCGTPTDLALETIRSVEGLDRGRYAGPVGWIDQAGDGEWGIALRCAEIDGTRGRLFSGAGIVSASEPEAELEETRIKFHAMMSALEVS
ncbi:MAG: isochorismate synthase MenF [Actinomycetota bacterium]